jgi:hypothetical protein
VLGFEAASGTLEVPLFIDFAEGGLFGGFGLRFDYRERARATFLMSSETRPPNPLLAIAPTRSRVQSDRKVLLWAIGTVEGGRNDGLDLTVLINGGRGRHELVPVSARLPSRALALGQATALSTQCPGTAEPLFTKECYGLSGGGRGRFPAAAPAPTDGLGVPGSASKGLPSAP